MEAYKVGNIKLQEKLADILDLTPSGHYFYGKCPFHDDHSPSFLLYPDWFVCKSASCGKQGTLEYLEKNISNIPTRPTIKKSKVLPRWRKWEERYGDIEGIAKAGHENVLKGNDIYYKKRKLDKFIKQGMFGLLDGWLTIPVFSPSQEIVDVVARAVRQEGVKYVLMPHDEKNPRPLYTPDWSKVLESNTIYVPYGMFDVWAFEAIGLPAVTGITGKAINPEQFSNFPNKNFIIVPDYGEERDAYRLANALGWRGSVLRLDYTYAKDPDELRRKLDEAQWKRMVLNEHGLVSSITG